MAARKAKSASASGAGAVRDVEAIPVAAPVGRGDPAVSRPKGSRNKLGEYFIAALCADFEAYGVDAITRVRDDDPAVYLRLVAQIVPQTVLVQDAKLGELSDDELAAYLFAVREALRVREGADVGASAAGGCEQAEPLPAISEAKGVS